MSAKEKKPISREEIRNGLKEFLLDHNRLPATINQIAKSLHVEERLIAEKYASVGAIEKDVWLQYLKQTKQVLFSDDRYPEMATREKVLSFYFTLIEQMLPDRSFICLRLEKSRKRLEIPKYLKKFKAGLHELALTWIDEGKNNNEILDRPYIGKKYEEAFWVESLFLIKFWVQDESDDFQQTDAAIEKSVNLLMDLLGKSPLDSILDFGRFLVQQKTGM